MEEKSVAWEKTVEWARVVAGCVIYKAGKYLLVQERQNRAYGLWSLPAGHVDKGETIEQAAVRETLEETGYAVELQQKIGVYHEAIERSVKHAYIAKIVGGKQIASSNEVLQVGWLDYPEIESLYRNGKLRTDWTWLAIQTAEAARLNQ